MASSSATGPRARPNRSAAERREQQKRADLRAYSRLLTDSKSFSHRGSEMPMKMKEAFASLAQTPSSSPGIPGQILDKLDSLEKQLHIVIGRLNSFDSYNAPVHASALQQQQRFDIFDLLDTAAIRRLDRALDETASQPDQVSSGHWWSCPFPGCGYSLQHGDRLRSQKKAQHRRKHEQADTGVVDPAQPTASPAETKPATKIVGKTKLADVKFVPLARTTNLEPGEEPSASSAPANSCLLATDVAPLEGKHITFAPAADAAPPAKAQPSHRVHGKTPSAEIAFKATSSSSAPLTVSTDISLVIHNLDNSSKFPCKFRRSRPLEHLFVQHCQAFSTSREKAAYIISDRNLLLQGTETADSLGLEDGAIIQFSKIDDSRDGLFW